MKRMTTEKPVKEMNMMELAHNCMYAKDGWARYRNFEIDTDLRDFIRKFSEAEGSELPDDNETLDDILMDNLQYGINDPDGRTALVYRLMWAMAELREALMRYEDTGIEPEHILTGVQLAEIACLQIRFEKMLELMEQAAEEIENCYGKETALSIAIRDQLGNQERY